MKLKGLIDEDFLQYKKPSMFIICPYCTFKCEKDCGECCCQNSTLATSPVIDIRIESIVKRYIDNEITCAIVIGGLEPMDSFDEVVELITALRKQTLDDIVVYTGYYEEEIIDKLNILTQYPNIIVKFGRFIPHSNSCYCEQLGITLASENQYAKKIS